jgi:hypothetical protein
LIALAGRCVLGGATYRFYSRDLQVLYPRTAPNMTKKAIPTPSYSAIFAMYALMKFLKF